MNHPEPEQEIVERRIRHAVGVNALRRIGKIVAEEQQADAEKADFVRWFMRYGWMVLLGSALLLAFMLGLL